MSHEYLEPCPFCGNKEDVRVKDRTHYGHGDSTCEVFVECGNCKSRGPDFGYWGTPTESQKLKAINAWNKRIIEL